MNCPKCSNEIGNAGYCTCGWKLHEQKVAAPRFSMPCAFAPECKDPAKHRRRHEGQFLNVCDRHDIYLVTHRSLRHLET